jgi:hypothetical protein
MNQREVRVPAKMTEAMRKGQPQWAPTWTIPGKEPAIWEKTFAAVVKQEKIEGNTARTEGRGPQGGQTNQKDAARNTPVEDDEMDEKVEDGEDGGLSPERVRKATPPTLAALAADPRTLEEYLQKREEGKALGLANAGPDTDELKGDIKKDLMQELMTSLTQTIETNIKAKYKETMRDVKKDLKQEAHA